jgi:hypothetical protein
LTNATSDGILIDKGPITSSETYHKSEEKITDLEESSSVESNPDSQAPLLIPTEAVKSESPGNTDGFSKNIKEADSNVSELDLNRTGSDDSTSMASDHDSKSPLLNRASDTDFEHIGNASYDEQNVLASDIGKRDDSDESSLDMGKHNPNVPLINN